MHVASILIYPNSTPSNLALAKTALLRTLPILKTTLDTATYARVISSLEEVSRIGKGVNADEAMEDEPTGGEAEGVPDVDWIEVTRDNERREGGRLDVELRGYMSNLIKESIRVRLNVSHPCHSRGKCGERQHVRRGGRLERTLTVAYLPRLCATCDQRWTLE